MNKELQNIINQYAEQDLCLESMVVSSFVINNSLTVQTGLLAEYYLEDIPIIGIESIEDVINVFELAIPKAERTKNGAVYTPKYIRDYIVERVVATGNRELQRCLVIDIACGCGAFLYTLANYLYINCGLSYREALQHLYGVDVSALSVNRCKILLSLAALQNGEILNDDDFKIFQGNSLSFDFVSMDGVAENGGFDIVVGNPPYVRAKHIDNESKALLPNWKVAKTGNADLYLPFFEIAYGILREDGVIGYITLNSFFKSVNARQLRSYFRENNATLEIVDFGNQLVFGKTLAYTCISLIHKQGNGGINYTKGILNSHGFVERPMLFNYISYESLDDHKGWHLNNADVLLNIRKIEGAGKSLGEMFQIKNGIATLANDVYILGQYVRMSHIIIWNLMEWSFPLKRVFAATLLSPIYCIPKKRYQIL